MQTSCNRVKFIANDWQMQHMLSMFWVNCLLALFLRYLEYILDIFKFTFICCFCRQLMIFLYNLAFRPSYCLCQLLGNHNNDNLSRCFCCRFSGHHASRQLAPRLFCDICDVFDLHDTDDCPQQGMSTSPPPSQHRGCRNDDRPYCTSCEGLSPASRVLFYFTFGLGTYPSSTEAVSFQPSVHPRCNQGYY